MINIQFTKKELEAISKIAHKEEIPLCIVNLITTDNYELNVEWISEEPIAFERHYTREYSNEWANGYNDEEEETEIEFRSLPLNQQSLALKLYRELLQKY